MKRKLLIKYLQDHGCQLAREGARHSLFINPNNGSAAASPRHPDINDYLAKEICKELDIPKIGNN